MTLNGCSKKLCPLQVGAADNCNLTKEQCPYFTQDIDYHRVLKQIKVEVAKEIFDEIDNIIYNLRDSPFYSSSDAVYELTELKKKYTEEKEDAEIH